MGGNVAGRGVFCHSVHRARGFSHTVLRSVRLSVSLSVCLSVSLSLCLSVSQSHTLSLSSLIVCTAQEGYGWSCTEAPQATPCMSGVTCPQEGVGRAVCQRRCEETAGCASIVHELSRGLCYLKGHKMNDGTEFESCIKTGAGGDDGEEDFGDRWTTACVLWGAGCSAASPLPWLMALFFAM